MLQSHLTLKDRKLQDLEAKLLKTDQELDVKFAQASKELEQSKERNKELIDENRSIRDQISDLSATSTGYEEMLRRKESEMTVLRNDVRKHEEDKQQLVLEKNSLTTRHDNMQNRLRELQAEMDAMMSEKLQLEKEVQDVKHLLEEKISEDAEAGKAENFWSSKVRTSRANCSRRKLI